MSGQEFKKLKGIKIMCTKEQVKINSEKNKNRVDIN